MATYRIVKNNLTIYGSEFIVTSFSNCQSIQIDGKYGKFWATQIDWETNNPELLEQILTDNEAVISFERIA